MSRTIQRRGAQALGAAAIFVLAFSGPATARPDEAGGTQQASSSTGQTWQEKYECHYLGKCPNAPSTTPRPPESSGNGYDVEYLQLGAGVLAGIGLAGAGMAATSRRRHGHAALPA